MQHAQPDSPPLFTPSARQRWRALRIDGATVTAQAGSMDRLTWLGQRRAAVLACYDEQAPTYDAHSYPTQTQQHWVARLLRACPAGSMILDAPCGRGRYFTLVTAAGHRVVCADQSAGMLTQARARGTAIALHQVRRAGRDRLPSPGRPAGRDHKHRLTGRPR